MHIPSKSSINRIVAAASTNSTLIDVGNVQLVGVVMANVSASDVYVKYYDKATAPDETDTPIFTIVVPANSNQAFDFPSRVTTQQGLGVRLTGGAADNDTTALSSGDIFAQTIYI